MNVTDGMTKLTKNGGDYFGKAMGRTQRFEVYTLNVDEIRYVTSFRNIDTAVKAGYQVNNRFSDGKGN